VLAEDGCSRKTLPTADMFFSIQKRKNEVVCPENLVIFGVGGQNQYSESEKAVSRA
jgi:hypothetical protein